jgi:hypothetical protein
MTQTAENILLTKGLNYNYKIIFGVTQGTPFKPNLMTPNFPWHIVSGATYAPSPFSWSNERDKVIEVATDSTVLNSDQVQGWFLADEPYGGDIARATETVYPGFRNQLRDEMINYKTDIVSVDQSDQRPFYLNLRADGNFAGNPPDYLLEDIQFHNYTLDSSLYTSDVHNGSVKGFWNRGISFAEDAMNNFIAGHNDRGYGRWAQAKNLDSYTPSTVEIHKYRYLAYSSWIMGGQGLFFFRWDDATTPSWLSYADTLAKEANAVKDWLMNGPATDIEAKVYDSRGGNNIRFILRRNQWSIDNKILLLFCNYANDGLEHTTYVHFPSHIISSVNQISDINMPYTLIDGNHTLQFNASNINDVSKRDVYGAAFFLNLTQN